MRIAVACSLSWPYIRRGNRCAWDLAVNLAKDGHDVHFVCPGPGHREVRVDRRGVHATYLPLRERVTLTALGIQKLSTFAWSCARFLDRGDFDLVQSTYPIDAYAARLHHDRKGTPYVHLLIDCLPFHPEIRLGRKMFRDGIAGASALIAISSFVDAKLRDEYGRSAEVIPLPVDIDHFTPRYDARSGPPRLLCTASLRDPRKRVDLLVRAFDHLIRVEPNAVLELAGQTDPVRTGELLGMVSERARRSIVVSGTGSEEELPGRYRMATLSVLPSLSEAFGLVVVESLASGTFVAGTRSGALPDILDEPGVGLLFEPDAGPARVAEVLATALDRARDPATPVKCRRHVEERYTWASIGPRYAQVYESALGAGRTRPGTGSAGAPPRPTAPASGRARWEENRFDEALESAAITGEEFFGWDWHRPACLHVLRWLRGHEVSSGRILVVAPDPRPLAGTLEAAGFDVETSTAGGEMAGSGFDVLISEDCPPPQDGLVGWSGSLTERLAEGGTLLALWTRAPSRAAAAGRVAGALEARGMVVLAVRHIQGRATVRRDWGSTPLKTLLRRAVPSTLARLSPSLRSHRFVAARKPIATSTRTER